MAETPFPNQDNWPYLQPPWKTWWICHGSIALLNVLAAYLGGRAHSGSDAVSTLLCARACTIIPTMIAVSSTSYSNPEIARYYLGADAFAFALVGLSAALAQTSALYDIAEGIGMIGIFCFLTLLGVMLVHALIKGVHATAKGTVAATGAVRAIPLHSTLQQRGYDWVSKEDARHLWELCGESAFKLPPWDDVGVLPGVTEGDFESLKVVLQIRRRILQREEE